MNLFFFKRTTIPRKEDPFHPSEDIKIVIDGTEVLNELPSVATSFAILVNRAHTHTLNLKYLKEMKFPFEFV